jgi:hypothetical protein
LRVLGWKNGVLKQQAVDFFLADFRSPDSTIDYIIHDWTWIDLRPLGDVDSILFNLSSSDTAFGYMNTPAYFALDNFTTADTAFAQPVANDDEITTNYLNDTLINVLANDAGLVIDPISVQLVLSPLISGAIAAVVNNQIHYTPAIGVVGTDTLTYTVCDDLLTCSTAKIIIHVTGITSVDEIIDGVAVKLYPNPFSNNISIRQSSIKCNCLM